MTSQRIRIINHLNAANDVRFIHIFNPCCANQYWEIISRSIG